MQTWQFFLLMGACYLAPIIQPTARMVLGAVFTALAIFAAVFVRP